MRTMLRLLAFLLCFGAASPATALSLEEQVLPGVPAGVTPWDLLGKASVIFDGDADDPEVTTVIPPEVEAIDGQEVRLAGFMFPIEPETPMRRFLLVEFPADCPFCLTGSAQPSRMVEVDAPEGIEWQDDRLTVEGRLEIVRADGSGLIYRLREARPAN